MQDRSRRLGRLRELVAERVCTKHLSRFDSRRGFSVLVRAAARTRWSRRDLEDHLLPEVRRNQGGWLAIRCVQVVLRSVRGSRVVDHGVRHAQLCAGPVRMSIQSWEVGVVGEWTRSGSSAQTCVCFQRPWSLAPCWPQLDVGLMRTGLRRSSFRRRRRTGPRRRPRLA